MSVVSASLTHAAVAAFHRVGELAHAAMSVIHCSQITNNSNTAVMLFGPNCFRILMGSFKNNSVKHTTPENQ